MSKALALNGWLTIKQMLSGYIRGLFGKNAKMGLWFGQEIRFCSNPATFVSPLALVVHFDAGLTTAVLSSTTHVDLSHLCGEGRERRSRYPQLCISHMAGAGHCPSELCHSPAAQSHPLTCQRVLSISKEHKVFCFIEINLYLKGILQYSSEKGYVVLWQQVTMVCFLDSI